MSRNGKIIMHEHNIEVQGSWDELMLMLSAVVTGLQEAGMEPGEVEGAVRAINKIIADNPWEKIVTPIKDGEDVGKTQWDTKMS